MNFKSSLYILIAFLFFTQIVSTQNIIIEGSVVDEFDYEVPFAAVGILKKILALHRQWKAHFHS